MPEQRLYGLTGAGATFVNGFGGYEDDSQTFDSSDEEYYRERDILEHPGFFSGFGPRCQGWNVRDYDGTWIAGDRTPYQGERRRRRRRRRREEMSEGSTLLGEVSEVEVVILEPDERPRFSADNLRSRRRRHRQRRNRVTGAESDVTEP